MHKELRQSAGEGNASPLGGRVPTSCYRRSLDIKCSKCYVFFRSYVCVQHMGLVRGTYILRMSPRCKT